MTTRSAERGSAIIPAVALLAALTTAAMMALLAGGADLALATRQSRERAAFYAAESAMETTLVELADGAGPLPPETFFPPWPAPGAAERSWRDGAWECSRALRLVPDTRDADGDPATTVVLFDRSFGYADSPLERGGYPVVQVLVAASAGAGGQGIAAEVAPVTCAPPIEAAWTAAGPLDLAGDLRVGGSSPAIACRGGVQLRDGAAVDGGVGVDPGLGLPADLSQLLGAGGTLPRFESLPAPREGARLTGISWSRGDYQGSLDGEGILVVHNPLFDPVRHEASRRAAEEGVFGEGFDPAYSHLDPARRPARLDLLQGGSFTGVIVADVVGTSAAPFALAGGLVTLSRSPQAVTAYAPLRVVHSAAAVARAGRGPLSRVTAYRPLGGLVAGLP